MAEFVISRGYDDEKKVAAERFCTQDDFVDFVEVDDSLKFRMRTDQLHTVDKQTN